MRIAHLTVALCLAFTGCVDGDAPVDRATQQIRGACSGDDVLVCHGTGSADGEHELCVGSGAVGGHLGHGDRLGTCCQDCLRICETAADCCAGSSCLMLSPCATHGNCFPEPFGDCPADPPPLCSGAGGPCACGLDCCDSSQSCTGGVCTPP